jgi:circadian clock protein KaiC
MQRLLSGAPGLDDVLGGGFPENAIHLIAGLPGSGKTLLAQQHMFANATADRPGVYLSTVSEPFEKVIRYGQTLSFFDSDAVGTRVFYKDLGSAILKDGLRGVLERVEDVLNDHEPGVLVIDSFKPLGALASSRAEFRRFLHELAARLSIRPVTTVWLGEYVMTEMPTAPEFAVADSVLWLASSRHEEREHRVLQVVKLRGSPFLSGRHAYRLSADGIRVFPRLADPGQPMQYSFNDGRISSGVKALDQLLGDGYHSGSSTLVAGPSGVGKTILGLHFVFEGVRRRESALLATMEENPSQLARVAAGFGWSFDTRHAHLMYRSAVDLYLDEWVHELLEEMDSLKARRVFIDGLGSLQASAPDPVRFREYMYSLVQRCSRLGVSLMMSIETTDLFGLTRLTDVGLSQAADSVLLLQFVRSQRAYRRAITILKSRAIRSEPRLYEYTIGAGGIALAPRVGEAG